MADFSLRDFVATYSLPQIAKVTQGFYNETDCDDGDFSTNDVITIHGVQCPKVEIKALINNKEFRATVSSRNTTRFRLHAVPRHLRQFSTVQELCKYWPLSVKALRDHVPQLRPTQAARPPAEFVQGDVLHLVRRNVSNSKSELECRKNASPDIIRLPVDYVGPFLEVIDTTQLYTLGELAEMAPVGRELVLLPRDQPWFTAGPTERRSSQTRTSTTWVDGLPPTFSGRLTMSTPEYLVEVSEMETKTMVPLDSEIRLQVRDGDYECLTCCQQRLGDLISMPASRLPRIVRIVAWDEETTVLRNHSVRPGQLLICFERISVAKLAVSREVTVGRRRHLLVPLTHGGYFRRTSSPQSALRLTDLSRCPFGYPFTLTYHEEPQYANLQDELLLPSDCLLLANGIVDEDTVLVARISEYDALTATQSGDSLPVTTIVNAECAFYLPLRTKMTVCFGEMLRRPVRRVLSHRSNCAEELSETTYNRLVGLGFQLTNDYVRPPTATSACDVTQPSAVPPLSILSTTATRPLSPQYLVLSRRRTLAVSGGGSDTDSSTDDSGYTALDLPPRRQRRRPPTVFRRSRRPDDNDHTGSAV